MPDKLEYVLKENVGFDGNMGNFYLSDDSGNRIKTILKEEAIEIKLQ